MRLSGTELSGTKLSGTGLSRCSNGTASRGRLCGSGHGSAAGGTANARSCAMRTRSACQSNAQSCGGAIHQQTRLARARPVPVQMKQGVRPGPRGADVAGDRPSPSAGVAWARPV